MEFPEPVVIVQLSLGAFHTACVDNLGRLWTFGKEVRQGCGACAPFAPRRAVVFAAGLRYAGIHNN